MKNKTSVVRLEALHKQKAEVEDDIKRFEAQLQVGVDPDIDEADPGLTLQTVTIALLRNARRKIESIERALAQAKIGGYGICETCGQAIAPERLEIFPQSTLCVSCKSKQEAKNGRYRAAYSVVYAA